MIQGAAKLSVALLLRAVLHLMTHGFSLRFPRSDKGDLADLSRVPDYSADFHYWLRDLPSPISGWLADKVRPPHL